ncbi:unnamed protein product [Brassica rapa]|uniref:Uncharacterized protein n=1 Tax=Brassica campestris TaxID=3711 RepID=A0A8D9LV95_BRACM|nr:unnamed protein product [Brassica rapa]
MVNLQRQRKKTEEKHELKEEIGSSENVRTLNYLVEASSENSSAPSNPPENSPAPSGELVRIVGFDHRRIRNQSGNSQIWN